MTFAQQAQCAPVPAVIAVEQVLQHNHNLVEQKRRIHSRFGPQHYVPTPEEIAESCLLIQAGWSKSERRRRKAASPADLDEDEGGDL